jgi:hypothetical protein
VPLSCTSLTHIFANLLLNLNNSHVGSTNSIGAVFVVKKTKYLNGSKQKPLKKPVFFVAGGFAHAKD